MEFTKELKNDWITALESGDYKKTEAAELYNDGCYCALGVFCVVANLVKHHDEFLYRNKGSVGLYEKMEEYLTEDGYKSVYRANDSNTGDNFKAAIEAIKDLQTTN